MSAFMFLMAPLLPAMPVSCAVNTLRLLKKIMLDDLPDRATRAVPGGYALQWARQRTARPTAGRPHRHASCRTRGSVSSHLQCRPAQRCGPDGEAPEDSHFQIGTRPA